MNSKNPIGVFDSGLGGISVLHTMHSLLPSENLIYLGDSKYNPYGTKTKEEITKRCIAISDEFIKQDVKAIVIACNTATSACVKLLREKYDVDIIGMEPALKVACDRGSNQRIAVWATELTLSEKKFANLMDRFKDEHHIVKVPCPKLVRMVEDDKLDDTNLVESVLKEYLAACDYKNLDSIVLGCTHFPFYTKYLERLCPNIHIIEGSVGTTLHTKDLLEQKGLLNRSDEIGSITWMNTMESKIELSKRLFKMLEVEA
ncbi:glutamate racemase [Holdemanella biformis]|uniref:glutamate racemase n=1 Tax=Holdemanella biformis TaxID=1735 RepID=UPI002E79F0D4|nr:glutamate racemase [Holdemanella biformis]MEE0394919.1 glutamate racemase [Holdemanella biformis]